MNLLDNNKLDRIAEKLGAIRRGTVVSRSGYFGALETAANLPASSLINILRHYLKQFLSIFE